MDEEPGPDDIVLFPEMLKTRIARIMTAASVIAANGHCTVDDWQSLRATMYLTTEFNKTIPVASGSNG